MDRAEYAANQWARERPEIDTEAMVLLGRLAEAAMISSGSMTNRIDRLEKVGFVTRKPNPADKRGTLVALTKQGLALIDRVIDAHVTNQQAIVNGLTAREQSQLSALLAKLLKGQEAPET